MEGENASPLSLTVTEEEVEEMVAKFSVGLKDPMIG